MEVLCGRTFDNDRDVQRHFDRWRDGYNLERPHEALGMQVPASRYLASARPYPQSLLPIEYGPGDIIRKVQAKGHVHYRGRDYKAAQAFRGYPNALRPTTSDRMFAVNHSGAMQSLSWRPPNDKHPRRETRQLTSDGSAHLAQGRKPRSSDIA